MTTELPKCHVCGVKQEPPSPRPDPTTMLAMAAGWHESQARSHEDSAAILERFGMAGEYHTAMSRLHQQFAVAIREADGD